MQEGAVEVASLRAGQLGELLSLALSFLRVVSLCVFLPADLAELELAVVAEQVVAARVLEEAEVALRAGHVYDAHFREVLVVDAALAVDSFVPLPAAAQARQPFAHVALPELAVLEFLEAIARAVVVAAPFRKLVCGKLRCEEHIQQSLVIVQADQLDDLTVLHQVIAIRVRALDHSFVPDGDLRDHRQHVDRQALLAVEMRAPPNQNHLAVVVVQKADFALLELLVDFVLLHANFVPARVGQPGVRHRGVAGGVFRAQKQPVLVLLLQIGYGLHDIVLLRLFAVDQQVIHDLAQPVLVETQVQQFIVNDFFLQPDVLLVQLLHGLLSADAALVGLVLQAAPQPELQDVLVFLVQVIESSDKRVELLVEQLRVLHFHIRLRRAVHRGLLRLFCALYLLLDLRGLVQE